MTVRTVQGKKHRGETATARGQSMRRGPRRTTSDSCVGLTPPRHDAVHVQIPHAAAGRADPELQRARDAGAVVGVHGVPAVLVVPGTALALAAAVSGLLQVSELAAVPQAVALPRRGHLVDPRLPEQGEDVEVLVGLDELPEARDGLLLLLDDGAGAEAAGVGPGDEEEEEKRLREARHVVSLMGELSNFSVGRLMSVGVLCCVMVDGTTG